MLASAAVDVGSKYLFGRALFVALFLLLTSNNFVQPRASCCGACSYIPKMPFGVWVISQTLYWTLADRTVDAKRTNDNISSVYLCSDKGANSNMAMKWPPTSDDKLAFSTNCPSTSHSNVNWPIQPNALRQIGFQLWLLFLTGFVRATSTTLGCVRWSTLMPSTKRLFLIFA